MEYEDIDNIRNMLQKMQHIRKTTKDYKKIEILKHEYIKIYERLNSKTKHDDDIGCLVYYLKKANIHVLEVQIKSNIVNLNQQDHKGRTILHMDLSDYYTISKEYISKLKLFLSNDDINVNIINHNGFSPIMEIIFKYLNYNESITETNIEAIILFLKDKRVDINMQDFDGKTIMHYFCEFSISQLHNELFFIFLKERDDIDFYIKDDDGEFPLDSLLFDDHPNNHLMIKFLLTQKNNLIPIWQIGEQRPEYYNLTNKYSCDVLPALLYVFVLFFEQKIKNEKFFNILNLLPIEIKMLICNMTYNSNKRFINQEDINLAIKYWKKNFV
jgi:hypothetical protein